MNVPFILHALIDLRASADASDNSTGVRTRTYWTSLLSPSAFLCDVLFSITWQNICVFGSENEELIAVKITWHLIEPSAAHINFNLSQVQIFRSHIHAPPPPRKWECFTFERVQITKEFSNRDKIKNSEWFPEELEYQCLTFYLSITLAPKNECKNVIKTTCTIFCYEI